MANINKIKLSGTTYNIQDLSASKSVELTQAQYDALTVKDPNTFYVITDAQGADLSNYYTKSETSGATEISTALNAKQDTLVSGTNIKTINNESILGSGNITIQGGGGSSYTAGDGIDITNDVISVTGMVDTTTFNTYSGSVDTALSGKVDTSSVVTAVTSASTDNEIPTAKAVYDAIPQGGGGKAVSGGTNISVTTGETADTINCTLPFSYEGDNLKTTVSGNSFVDYFHYGQIFGINNTLQGGNSATRIEKNTTIIGYNNQSLRMDNSIVIGSSNNLGNIFAANNYNYIFGFSNTVTPGGTQDNIVNNNFVIGNNNTINKKINNFIFGYGIKPSNNDEFSLGKYNNSVSASTTFGDSGNTLFSVGNGTADNARHNAFEIRQNGDIYISSGGTDIKLQDHLGGGGGGTSYTAGDGIDITNDVISVTGKVDTSTFNTYSGSVDTALSGKQDTLSAGTGIDITDNVISATGGGGSSYTAGDGIDITNDVISVSGVSHNSLADGTKMLLKGDVTSVGQNYSIIGFDYYYGTSSNKSSITIKPLTINGYSALRTQALSISVVETSAITTSVTSSSTDAQVPSAKAVYDQLGGMKIVKLTESEYTALVTKDSDTLYVVVPDPSN